MIVEKKPAPTVRCWQCLRYNPVDILPGVRLTKCSCGAIHPASTARLVAGFFNADKQPIYLHAN